MRNPFARGEILHLFIIDPVVTFFQCLRVLFEPLTTHEEGGREGRKKMGGWNAWYAREWAKIPNSEASSWSGHKRGYIRLRLRDVGDKDLIKLLTMTVNYAVMRHLIGDMDRVYQSTPPGQYRKVLRYAAEQRLRQSYISYLEDGHLFAAILRECHQRKIATGFVDNHVHYVRAALIQFGALWFENYGQPVDDWLPDLPEDE